MLLWIFVAFSNYIIMQRNQQSNAELDLKGNKRLTARYNQNVESFEDNNSKNRLHGHFNQPFRKNVDTMVYMLKNTLNKLYMVHSLLVNDCIDKLQNLDLKLTANTIKICQIVDSEYIGTMEFTIYTKNRYFWYRQLMKIYEKLVNAVSLVDMTDLTQFIDTLESISSNMLSSIVIGSHSLDNLSIFIKMQYLDVLKAQSHENTKDMINSRRLIIELMIQGEWNKILTIWNEKHKLVALHQEMTVESLLVHYENNLEPRLNSRIASSINGKPKEEKFFLFTLNSHLIRYIATKSITEYIPSIIYYVNRVYNTLLYSDYALKKSFPWCNLVLEWIIRPVNTPSGEIINYIEQQQQSLVFYSKYPYLFYFEIVLMLNKIIMELIDIYPELNTIHDIVTLMHTIETNIETWKLK